MQEQTKMNTVLPIKIKIDELAIKKFMPQNNSESLRPVPSMKRRKTLRPKVIVPQNRKTI